jgi:hypothetical protein
VIFSNSEDWLDSSILGYIMRIYRDIASESVNANNVALATKKKATMEEKVAAKSRPMALTINLDNSDLILLDIHPYTQGDFVGFGSHFNSASVHVKLRLPAEPLGLILDWLSEQQLYLFSGYISTSLDLQYFTNIFPISCHAHKFDADPLMMKSSLILTDVLSSFNQESSDIANRLIRENLQALGKGMSLLSSDKKGIVHYVQNSWSEISRGMSIATQSLSSTSTNRVKEDAKMQMESLFGLTMHLLESSKAIRRRELVSSSCDDQLQEEILSSSENELVQHLRAEIHVNYRRLQLFNEQYNHFPEDLLSSIEDIDRSIKALDHCVDKLEHFAILTSDLTPSYCGWLRKSHGFSRSDRSVHGPRYWCLLVRETLYFMNQPYAKKVEFEVYMDRAFILIDPDELDTTAGSNSKLSSYLWMSNPERNANDEGVFVLDCLTLDEKCMWKEALKAWTAVDLDSTNAKKLSRSKSILSFHFGSTHVITSEHGQEEMMISEKSVEQVSDYSSESVRSTNSNVSNAGAGSGSKGINRFRALSKGMLRAISMSRKPGHNSNHSNHLLPAVKTAPSSSQFTPPSSRRSSLQAAELGNPPASRPSAESAMIGMNHVTGDRDVPSTANISDLLNELNEIRPPLYQHTMLMESLRNSYLKKFQETKHLVEAMRDSFLALFLGLSILHAIENEVALQPSSSYD